MGSYVDTLTTYVNGLATAFSNDMAGIVVLDDVVSVLKNNKYFDNVNQGYQLAFMTSFLDALPDAILNFKLTNSIEGADTYNGFDINKLMCALDYAISKFSDDFDSTYYNAVLDGK